MKFQISLNTFQFIPTLQSHRGWHQDGIFENTIGAIQKAYTLGYEMVEFDVRSLADGTVVVFHDRSIAGIDLEKLSFSDFTTHFLKLSSKTTTLADLLEWFSSETKSNFKLNIEIKSNRIRVQHEASVLELIQKFKIEDRVLISSFNPFTLSYFRKKAPEIFRSLLLTHEKNSGNNYLIRNQRLNFLALPNALHLREADWISDRNRYQILLDRNIPVVLWTVNDLEKAKGYLAEGITSIISDTIKPKELA